MIFVFDEVIHLFHLIFSRLFVCFCCTSNRYPPATLTYSAKLFMSMHICMIWVNYFSKNFILFFLFIIIYGLTID